MPKPSTDEIQAAIAALISANSSEPYGVLAKRLNISVSSLRRIAAKFGITRQKSVEQTVLDTLAPNWAQELQEPTEGASHDEHVS
jgi:hypothetical protein